MVPAPLAIESDGLRDETATAAKVPRTGRMRLLFLRYPFCCADAVTTAI